MAHHFEGLIPPTNPGHAETGAIYGAVITVTVLATIAVILRFVARRKSEASISYDDYSIVLALVFLYGLNIDTIFAAALWGLGEHFFTLSKDQLLHFQKNGLASLALYFTTNATTKMSLLLLYYRLFSPSRRFRIAVYTAAVVVVAWWLAVLFADIFQCVPVNAFWAFHVKNVNTARCMDTFTFSIGTGVSNLVTDIMVLCLPMPMVWSLRTNRAQKISLTGVFLLGFFVCAISIVRIVKLVAAGRSDPTYSLGIAFTWSSVEPSVGIISACLPIMRALFSHRLFSTGVPTHPRSNKTPSAKKIPMTTSSSSQPASVTVASPVHGHFTRLDGPTYRDQLELSYRDRWRLASSGRTDDGDGDGDGNGGGGGGGGGPVANGSYGDRKGVSWLMYGPGKGDAALEEGSGVEEPGFQLRQWPRGREGPDWRRG